MKVVDLGKTTFILDGTLMPEKCMDMFESGIALIFNDGRYVTIKIEQKED